MALYSLYTDNVVSSGTVTLTSGSADSLYPLVQLYDYQSWKVFKATGSSASIRVTFGAAQTIKAIALINTNLEGATIAITNNNGLSTTITAPTVNEDGHRVDVWKDLRLITSAATQWNIAITGASANVAIGELVMVTNLRYLPISWAGQGEDEEHRTVGDETDYDLRLRYGMGVRCRTKSGTVKLESYRSSILSLERSVRGSLRPFLLIWEETVNDALFVTFDTDKRSFSRPDKPLSEIQLVFKEQQKGLAL